MHLTARIPLAAGPNATAQVEVQRSGEDGATYSHGRGLRGVVRVNRTTIPSPGDTPMLVELVLSDFSGGSEGEIRAMLALRAEDFR